MTDRKFLSPFLPLVTLLTLLAGCTASSEDSSSDLTYHQDIKHILDAKCVNCHQAGEIAPFSLSTYEQASTYSSAVANSVEQGTMPPWMPDNTCNSYQHDLSLSDDQREDLLNWVDIGSPKGIANGEDGDGDDDGESAQTYDLTLTMAEPYTPQLQPDDYRCFVLDWQGSEEQYVTGFRARPGNTDMVHHVISFVVNPSGAEDFRAMDAADDGAGYTCFGSPAVGPVSVASYASWRWLGSWAPGIGHRNLPAGTGVRVAPGSVVIMQVHYYAPGNEVPSDLTSFELQLSDQVEKPAVVLPITRYSWINGGVPMTIPAGSPNTIHSMEVDLSEDVLAYMGFEAGLESGDSFQVHSIGLHMHLLGTRGRIWIERSGAGEQQCLLDIPSWDFNWQGAYDLQEPITVHGGDLFHLECEWDNTAENQMAVDGELLPAQDVEWGDGTRDEMCLAIAYITAP